MENTQLEHHQINFEKASKIKISIFLDQIDSPANLGSIFRNAEAFGVETIWIKESDKINLESTRFKRTARSTWKNMKILFYENYQTVFEDFVGLKIGLEITSNSKNITNLNITEPNQILLVLGNERSGISENLLQELDEVYHINMFGKNSSLNVSQTLGIALHEIRR